jgi:hypothetical protein
MRDPWGKVITTTFVKLQNLFGRFADFTFVTSEREETSFVD